MSIMQLIQKKKEQFRNASIEIRKQQAIKETEKLRAERLRQGELAKVEAQRLQARQDVDRITAFNEKARGPSKLKKFGQGVAKVMNKGKTGMSEAKQARYMKGIQFGAPASTGSKGLDTVGRGSPFGGQRNIDVGGRGLFNTTPEKKKEERTTIIIKQ